MFLLFQALVLILTSLLACLATIAIYRLWLHPLSNVPGPKQAALSSIWQARHVRDGRMFPLGKTLHRLYGSIVRVGPNEVWVDSEEGYKTIYGGSGFVKSDFYLAMSLAKPRWDWALRPHFPDTLDLLAERDLVRYRRQRRALGPVYQLASLKKHEPAIDDVLRRTVAALRESGGGQELDLREWMHIVAVECLAAVVLTWSPGYLRARSDEGSGAHGYQHWKRRSVFGLFPTAVMVESVSKTAGRWFATAWGIKYSPGPRFKPFFPGVYQKVSRRVNALSRPKPPKDDRKDLLAELIQLHQARPDDFTELYLRRMAVTNFGAGHETLAATLTAVIAMLGVHTDAQDLVASEVRETPDPTAYDAVARLRYTQAAIKEAQRLHPVIAMSLAREVPAGGVVLHGRYLPAGTTVGCNPVGLHRNAEIFGARVDEFVPERWLQGEASRAMERCNLFFGGGARTCPGRALAELIVNKTVAALVDEFDMHVTMPPEGETRSYFLSMLTGVTVKFIPRNKSPP